MSCRGVDIAFARPRTVKFTLESIPDGGNAVRGCAIDPGGVDLPLRPQLGLLPLAILAEIGRWVGLWRRSEVAIGMVDVKGPGKVTANTSLKYEECLAVKRRGAVRG